MQVAAQALEGVVGKNPSQRFVLKGEFPVLLHCLHVICMLRACFGLPQGHGFMVLIPEGFVQHPLEYRLHCDVACLPMHETRVKYTCPGPANVMLTRGCQPSQP